MGDEEEFVDIETVDATIEEMHTELIDQNTAMVGRARRSARRMYTTASKYDQMAGTCREIAALHILASRQLAETLGDLLEGEFDITITEGEFDDGDSDEEDTDD